MSLVIPVRQAESLRNNERTLKPAGTWKGTFESFEVRELPRNKEGELFKGYVGPEGRRLSIQIGSNEPLDGQEGVGGQKEFVDICLEDGSYSLDDTPYDKIPDEAWQLKASARVLANLAAALGKIELLDEENAVVADGFIDELESGVYVGKDIAYKTYHRKGRDGITRSEVEMFMAIGGVA